MIPIAPLSVKARALDVIFAIDGSNDLGGFARGASLVVSVVHLHLHLHLLLSCTALSRLPSFLPLYITPIFPLLRFESFPPNSKM